MKNKYYNGAVSDHFDGKRFFNPGVPSTDKSFKDMWRWKQNSQAAHWPAHVETGLMKTEPYIAGPRITMVGHASVLIQIGGLNIVTDPVWSNRAGPWGLLGPRRVTDPGIAFSDLPPVHVVLVSHNHYDHMDLVTLRRLHERDNPLVITSLGNNTIIQRAIPSMRVAAHDWNETIAVTPDLNIALTPAYHWSARGILDRRMALWCGFVIHHQLGKIYFAGDTAYGDAAIFHHIRAQHGAPDIALIPIGAYEPRWFMSSQHINPEEAIKIAHIIGAPHNLGIHWGTFQLTDEARDEPATRFHAAAQHTPASCVAAEVGKSYNYSLVQQG